MVNSKVFLCLLMSATTATAAKCPADPPCNCDMVAMIIQCDEPSLLTPHISFDEIPPFHAETDMSKWNHLNFSRNVIRSVEDSAFKNLGLQVKSIDLSHNRVSSISYKAFHEVTLTLTSVDLSYNELEDIPRALVLMDMLDHLDLSFNKIQRISVSALRLLEDTLGDKKDLKIDLLGNPFHCDCKLKQLLKTMKKFFDNFLHPHDLKCVSPPILEGRVLGAFSEDELICPTSPPTTSDPTGIQHPKCPAEFPCWCDFVGNVYCAQTNMMYNNVTFDKVPPLDTPKDYVWMFLHLSGHKIKEIEVMAFYPMKVRGISLTGNIIETIHQDAFFGTEQELTMLLLEGNRLSTVPDPVLDLPMLNTLDLSLNDIFSVDAATTRKLHNMVYSDIHGAVIKNEFFIHMGRNAFNCSCDMWDFHVFVKDNLDVFQDLNLIMCVTPDNLFAKTISSLAPEDFPKDCDTTEPTGDPDPTRHPDDTCPANSPCWCSWQGFILCSANLLLSTDGNIPNPLTEVPTWVDVKRKERFLSLNLDGNHITELKEGAFAGISAIQINIVNNTLRSIHPKAFDGMAGDLESLMLSLNFLTVVPEAVLPLRFMKTFDISYNHIQEISEDTITKMQQWRNLWIHNGTHWEKTKQRKGIQVRLGANHLNCDSRLCALHKWMQEDPWDFQDSFEIACVLPRGKWGKKVADFSRDELGCEGSESNLTKQLDDAITAKHTMAALFAISFLACLCLGAYLCYVSRFKSNPSSMMQFTNPLATDRQNSNGGDKKKLVRDLERSNEETSPPKIDAPVISQTFGNLYENSL